MTVPSQSQSGTVPIGTPSGTAVGRKTRKGAVIVMIVRLIPGGSHDFESWISDRASLEAQYLVTDPELSVLVRIMWITKDTEFQGGMDHYNTHFPWYYVDSTHGEHPEGGTNSDPQPIWPPDFIHNRATDVVMPRTGMRVDPPYPISVKDRMEVFDDELIAIDLSDTGNCPSLNPTRDGCRSLYPPGFVYLDVIDHFEQEFGFTPSFMSVTASENVNNLYDLFGETFAMHSLQGMGLQDAGSHAVAAEHSIPAEPGYRITHLYRRNQLIEAMQAARDRGIHIELSEYGIFPQFSLEEGSTGERDRVYHELAKQLQYVSGLSFSGVL